jgi:hypothetical protein
VRMQDGFRAGSCRRHVPWGLLAVALIAGCGGSSTPASSPGPIAVSSGSAPVAPPSSSAAAPTQTPVSAESNPPGDIPDNLAYVPFTSAAGHYRFDHPEGWAEQAGGTRALFTDKLNGVLADVGTAKTPPTVSSAKSDDVPRLSSTQPAFELRGITAVTMPGGSGVRIVYRRNSEPDAVTGRQYRDEVERYELVSHGHEVVLEMYGPVGADNVDAYRTMVRSLRIA